MKKDVDAASKRIFLCSKDPFLLCAFCSGFAYGLVYAIQPVRRSDLAAPPTRWPWSATRRSDYSLTRETTNCKVFLQFVNKAKSYQKYGLLFFADIIRIKILFATYIRYRLFSLGVSQRVRNHNKLVYRIEACLVLIDLKLKVTLPRALKSENFAKYFLREIFRKIILSEKRRSRTQRNQRNRFK